MAEPVLRVQGLSVAYGDLRAVDGVSFEVAAGETLGLVGESGCGKSTAALGALRLLPAPAAVVGGQVWLDGQDLTRLSPAALRAVWGARAGLVPQGALSCLNPFARVRDHFTETWAAHGYAPEGGPASAIARALARVGLAPAVADAWPHALSGGMRQRVAIALATALRPPLLVLDEPTTALDVVVERALLGQLRSIQQEDGFAAVFVTHDLSLLLELADRVAVLYAGRLVEIAPASVLAAGGAAHPYTRGLLAAIPPEPGDDRQPTSIPGAAARVSDPPPGCRFHPRCARATDRCRDTAPVLAPRTPAHAAACHHPVEAP